MKMAFFIFFLTLGGMMLFTDELYKSVKVMWEDFCKHPFVDGIGSGKLDKEKFKFYMIQDYLYLLDYAKVYSLGVVKSTDEETMAKFSALADGILNTEMSIHKNYMKKLGITSEEIQNCKMSLSNISYTHYMLAVSYAGGVADVAVSLLSCLWSYEIIGKYLYNKYGIQEEGFYADWIKGYISEDYHKLNEWLLALVNKHAEGLSQREKDKLTEIFVNTTRYEGLFWDMAYNMEM